MADITAAIRELQLLTIDFEEVKIILNQSTMVVNSESSETDAANDEPVIGELNLGEERQGEEKQDDGDIEDLGVDSIASSV